MQSRLQNRAEKMRFLKTATLLVIGSVVLAGCTVSSETAEPIPTATETNLAVELGETEQVVEPEAESSAETSAEESAQAESSAVATEELEVNVDFEQQLGSNLSEEEIILAALMGPDGEYAALASYQAVLDEFGQVEPYATILEAESRHANALIRQLERLGVEVPENPYLGFIEAPADLQTAAEAWAEGEILNVALYDYLLTQTDNSQLTKVLNNLRSASLNSHLPAFEAAAENGGVLETMVSNH